MTGTDALTDVLRSIRMTGSVFSRADLAAPWGVESGRMSTGVFHAVVRGRAYAQLADSGPAVALDPGDVVLIPFGDNHLMTDAVGRPTRPIGELTTVDARGMGQLVVDGAGERTSLLCGTLAFDQDAAHPMLSLMPRLVHVRDRNRRLGPVAQSIIDLIANEIDEPTPGSETIVARLTDALAVYVLRDYIESLGPGEGGWLGALRDPAIGDALALLHRHPDRAWTVADLAAAVGMSRSAFFARFRELVGETPVGYLTRWRVQLAIRLLRDEGRSVAAVSHTVGYRTEAAFSNAFVRVMGVRPGSFKRAA